MYFPHPSIELQSLFRKRPFQGAHPQAARFIFVGLDANFSPEIESSGIFKEVSAYLRDGERFWREHGVHHPFLRPGYQGDGVRYHKQFAKIGFGAKHASEVSFVELIDVPTFGKSQLDKQDLLLHESHLSRLDSWFKAGGGKYVFIPPGVLRLLGLTSRFEWLGPEPICFHGSIPVYYQSKELTVFSIFHLSCYGRHCREAEKSNQLREIGWLIS